MFVYYTGMLFFPEYGRNWDKLKKSVDFDFIKNLRPKLHMGRSYVSDKNKAAFSSNPSDDKNQDKISEISNNLNHSK